MTKKSPKEATESLREQSKKAASDDAFERLGDNAAGVLRGHVEKIEKKLEAIAAIRSEIKTLKKDAKADGFDAKAIDAVIKKRAVDDSVRLLFEEQVKRMEQALGMATLFDYANQQDLYSDSEADADLEAAA